MAESWGTQILVTLAHNPVHVQLVRDPGEALALLWDPDWGETRTVAYAAAERELHRLSNGSGSPVRARRAFFAAADAACNSTVEVQNIGSSPMQDIAAE